MTDRPVPLLGDTSLEMVQRIEHSLEAGFSPTVVGGLPGELQQRLARRSHRLSISGVLAGDEAAATLEALQTAAAGGEELTFSADITTALELQRVVIASLSAHELAGQPQRIHYDLELAESPPLPPPAQIEGFGGLDDFGLGDLGFDTDLLDDLKDLAGDVATAVEGALDVVDALGALADLDGLELGGVLEPLQAKADEVSALGDSFTAAAGELSRLFTE